MDTERTRGSSWRIIRVGVRYLRTSRGTVRARSGQKSQKSVSCLTLIGTSFFLPYTHHLKGSTLWCNAQGSGAAIRVTGPGPSPSPSPSPIASHSPRAQDSSAPIRVTSGTRGSYKSDYSLLTAIRHADTPTYLYRNLPPTLPLPLPLPLSLPLPLLVLHFTSAPIDIPTSGPPGSPSLPPVYPYA